MTTINPKAFVTEDIECPACLTPDFAHNAELGQLGSLTHFRCRHCGMSWSVEDGEDIVLPEDLT